MVYLNGDNDLEKITLKELNQLEKVGSTVDVNIIAMIDRHPKFDSSDGDWTGARMYHVTKDQDTGKINSKLLADLGEVNMGLADTLSDFIENARTLYPAQRYALILMNHGNGYQGASYDCNNGESWQGDPLDMIELKQALENSGVKLDILAFEACLMSMVEVGYQIKDYTDVMVAPEGNQFWIKTKVDWEWMVYPYAGILSSLTANPTMDARELAEVFVEEYENYYMYSVPPATISVLDLTQIEVLVDSLDSLAELLQTMLDDIKYEIKSVRDSVWEFTSWQPQLQLPSIAEIGSGFVDLEHLAELLKSEIPIQTINNQIDVLLEAIDDVVVAKWDNAVFPHCGLSIYFPDLKSEFTPSYSKLDFSVNYVWDDLVQDYLEILFASTFIDSWIEDDVYLKGIQVGIDNPLVRLHITPLVKDLLKESHIFDASPLWYNKTSGQIYLFSRWENSQDKLLSDTNVFEYELDGDEALHIVYRRPGSGSVVVLREAHSKLYLHIYDSEGHHVGLDYGTNQLEVEIDGACYLDLNDIIIVYLPPKVTDFRYVVDAAYAEETMESYNVTVASLEDGNLKHQIVSSDTIVKEKMMEKTIQISEDGAISIAQPQPWYTQYWYIYPIIIAAVLSIIFLRKRRKPESTLQITKVEVGKNETQERTREEILFN